MSMNSKIDFSGNGMRFGVADSDLQVIGEARCIEAEQSQPTMWSAFAQKNGLCPPNVGSYRYDRWEEDADLMVSLGVKHYRTSISWARVLTERDTPNEKALKWYENFFKVLRAREILIYPTLYHWELPNRVAQEGGWRNRATVNRFLTHCKTVDDFLGDYVEEYFVLNEPSCAALFGYHRGIHAPGEKNLSGALEASHNLLLAQGLAIRELVGRRRKTSTVVNIQPAYAESETPLDAEARRRSDEYWNRWFLDPLFLGSYPSEMVSLYGDAMPAFAAEDMNVIRAGELLNSLGLNYYNGEVVFADASTELGYNRRAGGGPTNDLGWPVFVPPSYPSGLYDALREVFFRYQNAGLKKIYITETGLAKAPDSRTPLQDTARVQFLKDHLVQAAAAIRSGVPLDAFFVWSFCDSFEWQDGHKPESQFGLVCVDPVTAERTPKMSALWYADVMKNRSFQM
jgi:beta-glucosidase